MSRRAILVCGDAASGKTTSLRNLPNQERWLYINYDGGKELPFPHKFKVIDCKSPKQLFQIFDKLSKTEGSKYDGVIIDTLSILIDTYESTYINSLDKKDRRDAWVEYADFVKDICRKCIANYNNPIIVFSHLSYKVDEDTGNVKIQVPVKGSTAAIGIEAYFSFILYAKPISIKMLTDEDNNILPKYKNDYLHITEEDLLTGTKYVFQTRILSNFPGEKIRSPVGLWKLNESFIDNDVNLVLNKLDSFYSNK